MPVIIGGLLSPMWLYFWLTGRWFAAVVGMLAATPFLTNGTWQGVTAFFVLTSIAMVPLGIRVSHDFCALTKQAMVRRYVVEMLFNNY